MEFKNQYAFLSNFYVLENGVTNGFGTFPTSENAYQALKVLYCSEFKYIKKQDIIEKFKSYSPNRAKQIGKKISQLSHFSHEEWHLDSIRLMRSILKLKFQQNPKLINQLLSIEDDIIEDNRWGDTFWGKCNGKGLNHLGQLLMELREEFKNASLEM